MKLKWNQRKNNATYDITDFAASITWSGSESQTSRSLEVSILYSPLDKNIKDLDIDVGDRLLLYENNKLLIDAMVYSAERVSEQGTITYTAYDELNRLLKSNGTYKFKNMMPEDIAKKVCKDLQITVGSVAKTKFTIKKLIAEGESFYNVIMRAYTKAHKANEKRYMPIIYNKKFYIIEKGELVEDFYLSDKVNITSSTYSKTIESTVNKVKIYNDKSKLIGEVKDKDSISLFGVFQDVYTKEDKVNATNAAKSMIRGIEKGASIDALGNINCISGYAIKIKDSISNLTGKFWIASDSHRWESGNYTMSLELAFKNLMDEQE